MRLWVFIFLSKIYWDLRKLTLICNRDSQHKAKVGNLCKDQYRQGLHGCNSCYYSHQRFDMQTRRKDQFCFVLPHSPCLYMPFNWTKEYLTAGSTVISAISRYWQEMGQDFKNEISDMWQLSKCRLFGEKCAGSQSLNMTTEELDTINERSLFSRFQHSKGCN